MNANKLYCIYAGTVRGAVAHVESRPDSDINFQLNDVEKSEIKSMHWGRSETEIIIGHQNGSVRLYNTLTNNFVQSLSNLDGDGGVCGLGVLDNSVLVARNSGVINIWSKNNVESFKLNLPDDSTLDCMAQNFNNYNVIATGGERNDLKLWDIETKSSIFKAKSMGHDELNLPIPTSVRGICFFNNENNLVSCATKEGHVLLYDGRVQRRPIVKFLEVKASYSAIACTYRDRQIVAGTTRGYIQLLDLRASKRCLRTYKSFTGGVTSLVCDISSPVVISTSLDRFVRIHDLDTKNLLYKKYMKQSLTQIVIKPIFKEEPKEEEKDSKFNNENVDAEFEEMFDQMETITEKSVKKRKKITESQVKHTKLKRISN